MARTIAEIKKEITDRFIANETIASMYQIEEGKTFDQEFSAVSIENILFYITAFFAWSIENLHDLFKTESAEEIAKTKPHSTRWYSENAKAFQFGFDLVPERDYYDNTGIADDVVLASKVITHAAVVRQTKGIRLKVATTVGDDLAKVPDSQLAAFKTYMDIVADAGVDMTITSGDPDKLKLLMTVVYNPLLLAADGSRLDGTSAAPVKDAIKSFLRRMPFNGVFSVMSLTDAIQNVPGVIDLKIYNAYSKYGLLAWKPIDISVVPDAGYLRMDDADFEITYLASE